MNVSYYKKEFLRAKVVNRSGMMKSSFLDGLYFIIPGLVFIILGCFATAPEKIAMGIGTGIILVSLGLSSSFSSKFRVILYGGNPADVLEREYPTLVNIWQNQISDFEETNLKYDEALFWGGLKGRYCFLCIPYAHDAYSEFHNKKDSVFLVAHFCVSRKRRPVEGFLGMQWIPLNHVFEGTIDSVISELRNINSEVIPRMLATSGGSSHAISPDPITLQPLSELILNPT